MGAELERHITNSGQAVETEDGDVLPLDGSSVSVYSGTEEPETSYETPLFRKWECNPWGIQWSPSLFLEMTEEQAEKFKYRAHIAYCGVDDDHPVSRFASDGYFDRSNMEETSTSPLTADGKVYKLSTPGFVMPPALSAEAFGIEGPEPIHYTTGRVCDMIVVTGRDIGEYSTRQIKALDAYLAYGLWYAENVLDPPTKWFSSPRPLIPSSRPSVNYLIKYYVTDSLSFMDDGKEFTFDVDGHKVKLVVDEYRAALTSGTVLVGRLVGWPRDTKPDGLKLPINWFTQYDRTRTMQPATEISDPVDGVVKFVCPGWPVEYYQPGTAVLTVDGKDIVSTEGRVGKFVLDAIKKQERADESYTETWTDDDGVEHEREVKSLDWPGQARVVASMMTQIYEQTRRYTLREE